MKKFISIILAFVLLASIALLPVSAWADTPNLIANPSVETASGLAPTGWITNSWGANTASFAYTTTGHTGHGLSVTISNYQSGDAKWVAALSAVVAGQSYTYSDYNQSTVDSELDVEYLDSSGNQSYVYLQTIAPTSTWQQSTSTFTIPSGIVSASVLHVIYSNGTLQTDDYSLTTNSQTVTPPTPPADPTPPATGANLIPNASFETANGANPAGWTQDSWGTNTAAFTYVKNDGHTGTNSAKVTVSKYTDGDAKWYFDPLALTPGAQYTYSAWYKATTTKVAVTAMYIDANGTRHYFNLPAPLVGASAGTVWQQYSATFQVPTDATAMSIFFLIEGNGTLQTDDVSITPYVPTGFSEPLISLTFDDGWTSIYDNAFPLLKKYGLVSTQYIISSYLGQPSYMSLAQVKALQTAGSEIGSHTVTHPDLTTLTATKLTTELSQSQRTLQKDFGASAALNIASPYGAYNQTVITAIKKYYAAHRSVDVGYNSKDNFDPYDILVQNITTSTTPADVAAWIAHAKATNTWLVIVYHNVNATGVFDASTTTTAYLDSELQEVKASGIPVRTMTQALAEVSSQL